jgi:hypothetical protein
MFGDGQLVETNLVAEPELLEGLCHRFLGPFGSIDIACRWSCRMGCGPLVACCTKQGRFHIDISFKVLRGLVRIQAACWSA